MNKVLILSGDLFFSGKNMAALAEAGFEVNVASNYLEGIKKVDSNGIAAIIIDDELPDMDIYQACAHIRRYFETPIILVACEADERIWAKVEALGFDFYLRKPVSPRELVARVKAVLRRAPEYKSTSTNIGTPSMYRHFKTGCLFPAETLQDFRLHSRTFNESRRKRLEFELEPKMRLLKFLKDRGYQVEESARVKGRSGAEHTLDLYAMRDDGVVSQTLAVAVLLAEDGEIGFDRVSLFDSKANDAGIHDKLIVALSKLNSTALQFARQHNIIVFEANDLNTLLAVSTKC